MGRGGGHHGGGGGHHGGGGGHHGGGGHSHSHSYGGHYHSHYHSYGRSYSSSGSGECGRGGYVTTIFFCIIVALALTIYLIYALLNVQSVYCRTASTDVFDGEQNLCNIGYSHDKVYIDVKSSMKDKFKTYLFSNEPKVLDQTRHANYQDSSVRLYGGDFTYYAFALPKGSFINFTVSASSSYAEWYFTTDYYSISDIRYNYIWKSTGAGPRSYNYTTKTSETFYVTCYNSAYSDYNSFTTSWNVDVDYKQYDLSNPKKTCTGQTSCKFTGVKSNYVVSVLATGSLSGADYTKNEITFGKDFSYLTSTIICCVIFIVICLACAIISIIKLCLIAAVVSTAVSAAVSSKSSSSTPSQTVVVVQQTPAPAPPPPQTPVAPYPGTPVDPYGNPVAPAPAPYSYGAPPYGGYQQTAPSAPPPPSGYAVL